MAWRPVILSNETSVRHFKAARYAMKFLGVRSNDFYKAWRADEPIKGWHISDDMGAAKRKYIDIQKPFQPQAYMEPPPRYAEIFTRKPFSATGIWKEEE